MLKARSRTCSVSPTTCAATSTTGRPAKGLKSAFASVWKKSRDCAHLGQLSGSGRARRFGGRGEENRRTAPHRLFPNRFLRRSRSAAQREQNDQRDQAQDGEDEDAAFWSGGSAAEDGLADGVGGEKMVLGHESAVGDAVEERLAPIPRSVEADGEPERAGAPQTEAEDHGGETGGEQPDGGFAWILAVTETEENGKDYGCGPESQGFAVASLEGPFIDGGQTAGECVLKVATSQILLEHADQEKSDQPDCSVANNVAAKKQTAVDDKGSKLH